MASTLSKAYETATKDQMIDLARELAKKAREIFKQDPSKTYVIEINGDPIAGKSLIVDYMKKELFGESEIPIDEDRQLKHYRGKIGDKKATISLVNEWTDFTNLTSAFAKKVRNEEPGFVFLLNSPKFKIFPKIGFDTPILSIDVKYPDSVHQTMALKYLHKRKDQPKTWERHIVVNDLAQT